MPTIKPKPILLLLVLVTWGLSHWGKSGGAGEVPQISVQRAKAVQPPAVSGRARPVPKAGHAPKPGHATKAGGVPKNGGDASKPDRSLQLVRLDAGRARAYSKIKSVDAIPGRATYAFDRMTAKGNGDTFLALCMFEPDANGQSRRVDLIYTVKNMMILGMSENSIFNPQFSPDGRYVVFKFGLLQASGFYKLYVFDTKTERVKQVGEGVLSYVFVSWSPDSNYLQFIAGGDPSGERVTSFLGNEIDWGELTLLVCDWRTGRAHAIVADDTLRGPFSWIGAHSPAYAHLDADKQAILAARRESQSSDGRAAPQGSAVKQPALEPWPDIYLYPVETNKPEVAIRNGFRPAPSPDGKWIVFLGPENAAQPKPLDSRWQHYTQGVALVIARRNGSERTMLSRIDGAYPRVLWRPDSSGFVTVRQTKHGVEEASEVTAWELATRQSRLVATLRSHSVTEPYRWGATQAFSPLSMPPDGSTLFVMANKIVGRQKETGYDIMTDSIIAVDLHNGDVRTVAEIQNANGTDWHTGALP